MQNICKKIVLTLRSLGMKIKKTPTFGYYWGNGKLNKVTLTPEMLHEIQQKSNRFGLSHGYTIGVDEGDDERLDLTELYTERDRGTLGNAMTDMLRNSVDFYFDDIHARRQPDYKPVFPGMDHLITTPRSKSQAMDDILKRMEAHGIKVHRAYPRGGILESPREPHEGDLKIETGKSDEEIAAIRRYEESLDKLKPSEYRRLIEGEWVSPSDYDQKQDYEDIRARMREQHEAYRREHGYEYHFEMPDAEFSTRNIRAQLMKSAQQRRWRNDAERRFWTADWKMEDETDV